MEQQPRPFSVENIWARRRELYAPVRHCIAYAVMAYIVMACAVMAYVVMACAVMAYVVMAYAGMACMVMVISQRLPVGSRHI